MLPIARLLDRPVCLALLSLGGLIWHGCVGDVGEGPDDPDLLDPNAIAPGVETSPAAEASAAASSDSHAHAGHTQPIAAAPVDMPKGWDGVPDLLVRPTKERATASDVGAFRTSCALSHMNNDDAIVFPGKPGAAHLHAYFGNTGANAFSTAHSLKNTGNSTCRGGIANRSAYWVPAVIDESGKPVKPENAQIYYKTGYGGIKPSQVQVFPEGLRMIAGDMNTATPTQEHAFWSCETYAGHPKAIPDCPRGEAVIMVVMFPQCWNGVDLDSTDHKRHMAYPVNGSCPASHPKAIPEVSFQIRYKVPEGTRSSEWRLSSDGYGRDKPGGYSAHGDWFEGWKREIAETFVKNCDQASMDCRSSLLGDGREIYSDQLDSAQL
jgi:hypothetical protein